MKIISEELLAEFRAKDRCEYCGRAVLVQPHHIFARGQESCRRLDVAINLIALCIDDHTATHTGQILREDLLAIVAKRERTTQQDIQEEIWRLRRL